MGIMDEAKAKMEEAKDLLSKGAEKAEEAIEKAGDAIDSKTERQVQRDRGQGSGRGQGRSRQGQPAALTARRPVPLQGVADHYRVWRSKLPDTLDKGTQIVSIVEVKGIGGPALFGPTG